MRTFNIHRQKTITKPTKPNTMKNTQLTIESSGPASQPAWARTEVPINTVMRCLEAATPMFADSAVVSVTVQADFGLVEVRRNGQCFMVQEVAV